MTTETNPLTELANQEQKKLAANLYRLTSLYVPYGRIPDPDEVALMRKRAERIAQDESYIRQLFPTASDKLMDKVKTTAEYIKIQFKALAGLKQAGAEPDISDDELYQHALSQDPTMRRLSQQAAGAAL